MALLPALESTLRMFTVNQVAPFLPDQNGIAGEACS